jgi:hypothetical protein
MMQRAMAQAQAKQRLRARWWRFIFIADERAEGEPLSQANWLLRALSRPIDSASA